MNQVDRLILPLYVLFNAKTMKPAIVEAANGPTFLAFGERDHAESAGIAIAAGEADVRPIEVTSSHLLLLAAAFAQASGATEVDVRYELIPDARLPLQLSIAEFVAQLQHRIAREGESSSN